MALVFLSLGSNLGDRQGNLNQAIRKIEKSAGKIVSRSKYYDTEPWGYKSRNNFINTVIRIETDLNPEEILSCLKGIESEMGRTTSTDGYADRQIDIDILFYENEIITTESLIVPHLLLQERRFVLEPLNEIAPDYIHPFYQVTVSELLRRLREKQD